MPIRMECPFLQDDCRSKRGALRITCEIANINFPNETERDLFIKQYCSSLHGWKDCTIAKATEGYYERNDTEC